MCLSLTAIIEARSVAYRSDGSYAIDCVEELIEHQKLFMEVVSQIRSENMFTFPVLTYSLLYRDDGRFVDEDFCQMVQRPQHDME